MPNHLSTLGIIHTAISILALIAAFVALAKEGTIDPKSTWGKYYVWLTVLTCITGFPIMRTGHFGPAHGLTIIVLLLLPLGVYARSIKIFGKKAIYLQVIVMSTTLFLSFVPAVNESLTRLPISHPLATSQDDPIVKLTVLIVFVLFLAGLFYQIYILRNRRKVLTDFQEAH